MASFFSFSFPHTETRVLTTEKDQAGDKDKNVTRFGYTGEEGYGEHDERWE